MAHGCTAPVASGALRPEASVAAGNGCGYGRRRATVPEEGRRHPLESPTGFGEVRACPRRHGSRPSMWTRGSAPPWGSPTSPGRRGAGFMRAEAKLSLGLGLHDLRTCVVTRSAMAGRSPRLVCSGMVSDACARRLLAPRIIERDAWYNRLATAVGLTMLVAASPIVGCPFKPDWRLP